MGEPDRLIAALSAVAGGVFWALFHVFTTLLAGQPVRAQDLVKVGANVAVGIAAGALVAYFLAPAVAPLIPFASLRDLHAVGFGIGALAWEMAPFIYRIAKARAGRAEREQGR